VARVFVSHAGEDLTLAREVHRWLVEAGHEVFLAQDLRDGIAVGEQWEQRLHDELRLADAVVCVLTSAYLASTWCAAEVGIARSRGSRLLPLRVEPDLAHPLLKSVQHTDLTRDLAEARAALVEVLRRVDVAWPEDRSPFPGLRPFEVDLHRVFFGRTQETRELAELLRSPAEHAKGAALLVVGPSGCGKSSLVRAGLVPLMTGEPGWWTLPPIVPGADPVAALARELAAAAQQSGLDWTVTQVHQQLDNGGLTELADELLLAAPGGPRRRLLIVVDQFEELLTQTAPADRVRFAELLRPTLSGPVQVVCTLRPEFLDQLLADSDLATLSTHVYPLRPLRHVTLRAVIEKPARLAGIDVDDGLVDRLVDDTDSGEALPLLAFTLAQLAEGVSRGGRLSSARYEQLGGVQGALIRQADAALVDATSISGRSRGQVIAGLLGLVTVDERGRPTRWRVNRDELPDYVVAELNAFVARRLLTTDTDNDTVVIGVAHEAFLSAWHPLANAIAANVSELRARRAVEHAAGEWNDSGRPPSRLWGGGQLAAAVADTGAHFHIVRRPSTADTSQKREPSRRLPRRHRVLVTDRVDLGEQARNFLLASIHRDRSRRRRTIAVLSVLLVFALTAAGAAVIQQRATQKQRLLAEKQQRVAVARQLIAQAGAALETDSELALRLGVAAQNIHSDSEIHTSLVNLLIITPDVGDLPIDCWDGQCRIETAQNAQTVQPRELSVTGDSKVYSVAFSPRGETLATANYDGSVILWDLADPTQPHRSGQALISHGSPVYSVAFSPRGETLATANYDGSVILWDLADPTQPRRLGHLLTGHVRGVRSVMFSLDEKRLATAGGDSVILWDVADPTRPRRLGQVSPVGTATVFSMAFAPDGRTLATSSGGTVGLWDVADPTRPRRLGQALSPIGTATVFSMAFAPDRNTLAAASNDDSVTLWDLTGLNDLRTHTIERVCSYTGRGLDRDEWAHYIPDLPYQDTCQPDGD